MRVPSLKMAPPLLLPGELSERVELEMLRIPALLNAPPLVVVVFAPETVTPDIDKSPSGAMSKILKLRVLTPLLPLMLSVEAPGPVMVRVPRVPPEIAVLALRI